jgi:hypothetical protein
MGISDRRDIPGMELSDHLSDRQLFEGDALARGDTYWISTSGGDVDVDVSEDQSDRMECCKARATAPQGGEKANSRDMLVSLLDPCLVFGTVAVSCVFGFWFFLMLHFWPTPHTPEEWLLELLVGTQHVFFMDIVPNWLTGYCLHRLSCLRRVHSAEHELQKNNNLSTSFMLSSIYGVYTLGWMFAWGLAIGCANGRDHCWSWHSAMWITSLCYAFNGFLIRLYFWRYKSSMAGSSTFSNRMSQFYWAHFYHREFEDMLCFGAQTPFWDVLFGTCPFDIKYSTPFPFVDFMLARGAFEKLIERGSVKWNILQVFWYSGWTLFIVLQWPLMVYLASGGRLCHLCDGAETLSDIRL